MAASGVAGAGRIRTLGAMRLLYHVLYTLGIKPWERLVELPVGDQLRGMFDRLQAARTPPFGKVLDLGCGTGRWAVELAVRGWNVTGVELVPKALRAARRRAAAVGVDVAWLQGDITALERLPTGTGFDLVLDLGAVHGMHPPEREAVRRGVDLVTAPGAELVMLAFTPAKRGPLPRGLSREEIAATYPGWEIVEVIAQDTTGAPWMIEQAAPSFYRLTRLGSPAPPGARAS